MTEPTADRLDDLRTEYANTGMVTSDGAVWLVSQVVVLREQVERLTAAVSVPPADQTTDRAALAEDLRYVLGYTGPRHSHEQPGVWDTSGKPCTHCARLAIAHRNLAAYDANPDAVLPPPADRAAVLLEAAAAIEAEPAREEATEWAQHDELDHETEIGGGYVRASAALLRRLAVEAQQQPDTETPGPERTVRDHVLALHQIGEQLAGIESWMWEHLAYVRAHAVAQDPHAPAAGARQDGAQQ